jgi:predicted transcriptional regulator
MKRRHHFHDHDRIRDLYSRGLTQVDVARVIGCAQGTVSRILHEASDEDGNSRRDATPTDKVTVDEPAR